MFVPSGDVVWRSSVLVHGILVEVAGVEVGLDGGKDGYLQCSLAEACWDRKSSVWSHNCENNNTIIIIMTALTFPVETIKPFVFLNVSNATFLITQSLCAVISEGWKD